MQNKASLNYPRLISPEVPVGCKYRRLRQAKTGASTVCLALLLGLLLTAAFPAGAGPLGPRDPDVILNILFKGFVDP
jgi:hypothetical protein